MSFPRRARTACVVVVVLLLGVLASDVAGIPGCRGACKMPVATAALQVQQPGPPAPPIVGISPFNEAEDLNPLTPVNAEVLDGRITAVSLVDDWGNAVTGQISPDGKAWTPTERLNFARSYSMTVSAKSDSGVALTRTSNFSTAYPNNFAQPYVEVQGGFAVQPNQKYGVGTVVVAHFDEPITDKALAERNMIVRTEPAVEGNWFWLSDTKAHWRPQYFYAPGTRIHVELNMFGLKLGEGLYGQADAKADLTIGDARIAIANDITKQISVFDNGALVRTMPTAMGRGGTSLLGGKTFHWWTPAGIYTVLDKGEVVIMDSATYGVPAGSAESYKRTIGFATRISTDGIYLHQLDDTVWAQGNTNVSSGCLNLSGENAQWYFNFVQPGDVVEVRYTGGPPLDHVHNGDWSVPWDQWVRGSALTPGSTPPPSPLSVTSAPGP